MAAEPGTKITFDEVLLASDGETVSAGTPLVKGASVTAEVVRHGKEKKIFVFKFKRRKNYPEEDRASAEVHRGQDHRRQGRVRNTWLTRRA